MSKKHIIVICALHADSKKAYALNTIKMADGFSQNGLNVTLICRKGTKKNITETELLSAYGVLHRIKVIQLPAWFASKTLFSFIAVLMAKLKKADIIFARGNAIPFFTYLFKLPTIVENHVHVGQNNLGFRVFIWAAKRKWMAKWITISNTLKKFYIKCGIDANKIAVIPDGVDISLFQNKNSHDKSPYDDKNIKHIVYTGHLYDYKGIPTVLQAAARLQQYSFHFVGGLEEDINRHQKYVFEKKLKNIIFHGYFSHSDIPSFLWHANILLLPPSLNHPSAQWTSPMKLGEYLASNTPTICSDIPALKDLVTTNEVVFFKADDVDSLIMAIENTLGEDTITTEKRCRNAANLANNLTYELRAAKIMSMLPKYFNSN